jgi:hypothetical protein
MKGGMKTLVAMKGLYNLSSLLALIGGGSHATVAVSKVPAITSFITQ